MPLLRVKVIHLEVQGHTMGIQDTVHLDHPERLLLLGRHTIAQDHNRKVLEVLDQITMMVPCRLNQL